MKLTLVVVCVLICVLSSTRLATGQSEDGVVIYPLTRLPSDCAPALRWKDFFILPENGGLVHFAVREETRAVGIVLYSETNSLLPVADGLASPFSFLVHNDTRQITYGNLGHPTIFEGGTATILSGGAVPSSTAEFDFSWGNGVGSAEPSPTVICDLSQVPEPEASQLSLIAAFVGVMMAHSAKRRQRKSSRWRA